MARVRKATGAAVPTLVLYRSPTVVSLAETLAGMPRAVAGTIPRAPFTPAQKAAGVPCPTVMETYGTAALVDPVAAGRAIIPVGLRLGGELDVAALHAALAAIVERHEPLRTRFVLRHGQARSGGALLSACLGAHASRTLTTSNLCMPCSLPMQGTKSSVFACC